MKRAILFVLIIIPTFLFSGSNGGYAGAFLRMGLGARSLALGNAGAAGQAGGYSFYYNPALSGFLEDRVLSISSSAMSLDRRFNYIGFSMKVPPDAGFSAGWINSGVNDFQSTNSIGEFTGEIAHSINAAYFNFARQFGSRLAAGLSIKYIWESLGFGNDKYSSGGWGWDFGILYRATDDLNLALVVRDVASKLKANTGDLFEFGTTTIDNFPVLYVAGVRYTTPLDWLIVLYDFEMSDKESYKNHLGFEAIYQEAVALRIGYDNDRITAGTGINFKALNKNSLLGRLGQLDYAFQPSILDEGSNHIFSWQIFWN